MRFGSARRLGAKARSLNGSGRHGGKPCPTHTICDLAEKSYLKPLTAAVSSSFTSKTV
jgi:hypothetical protein